MQETNDNLKFPVQWSILTWFITVNSVLTNLCQSVFNLPSSVSNADAETSAPPVGSAVNNAVLFQPTQQSDAASNHWDTEILNFLVYSLLSYAPDSVFNWTEVTDLETKIAVYDNALRRIGNLFLSLSLSLSLSIYLSLSQFLVIWSEMLNGGLGRVSAPPPQPQRGALQPATVTLSCLRSVLYVLAAYSVKSRVPPLSCFTQKFSQ